MKPDYKNWVPKGMVYGSAAGTACAKRNPGGFVVGIDRWGAGWDL